jgi:type IV pilus assembly protein PilA
MAMQPPAQPQGQPPPKKGMSTCLIVGIVLAVIGVPILGVMASLAIYGVRRYIATAKTAEAKNTIGAITRAAVAAYEREKYDGMMPDGAKHVLEMHHLCASATPVPAKVPAGMKYMPSSAPGTDFNTGSDEAGWKCLKFALANPTYYQYSYVTGTGSGKTGATANGFEASARGDLNGDGVTSFFARGADVRNGAVVVSTELYIENEFE